MSKLLANRLTARNARILRLPPRPLPGDLGVAVEAAGAVAVELLLLLAVIGRVAQGVVLALAVPALAARDVEARHHLVALLDLRHLTSATRRGIWVS